MYIHYLKLFLLLIVSGTTMVLVTSSDNPGPLIQIFFFMYSAAGFISPWLAKPFTSTIILNRTDTNGVLFAGHFSGDVSHIPDKRTDQYLSFTDKINNSVQTLYTTQFKENETIMIEYSDLRYIYVIIGIYLCLISVLCFVVVHKTKTWKPIIKSQQNNGNQSTAETISNKTDNQYNVLKVVLFTIFLTFECSIELGFSGILVTFIIKHLHWQKETAMFVTSVLHFTVSATRLIVALASKWVKPVYILTVSLTLIFSAVLMLSCFVDTHPTIMWICTIVIGLSSSTTAPTTLTWASSKVIITGKVTSAFMSPFATAMVLGPTFIGFIFDKYGEIWYCYMLTIYAVITGILFLVILVTTKCMDTKYDSKSNIDLPIQELLVVNVNTNDNNLTT